MLPMRFFANRGFAVTNVRLAGHVLRDVRLDLLPQPVPAERARQHARCRPGVKLLVWTGATMVVSPLAGYFSERFGSRPFMVAGLALQALALGWLASDGQRRPELREHDRAVHPRRRRDGARVRARRPTPCWPRSATDQAGQASGATNAIRELGGVLGIAVLATVFTEPRQLRLAAGLRQRPDARRCGSAWRCSPPAR